MPFRCPIGSGWWRGSTSPCAGRTGRWVISSTSSLRVRKRRPSRISDMAVELEMRNPRPRPDNQAPELFGQTPSQTVGPFFHYGLPWKGGADLIGKSDLGARPDLFPENHHGLNRSSPHGVPQGEAIELRGRVLDGQGVGVPDAMLEIWQANAGGRYASLADT